MCVCALSCLTETAGKVQTETLHTRSLRERPQTLRQHAGSVGVFGEAVGEALALLQRGLPVAHGTQAVALLRRSHPHDEVPALAGGDGQGPVHVLAPVQEPLRHPVLHLAALRVAQRDLQGATRHQFYMRTSSRIYHSPLTPTTEKCYSE